MFFYDKSHTHTLGYRTLIMAVSGYPKQPGIAPGKAKIAKRQVTILSYFICRFHRNRNNSGSFLFFRHKSMLLKSTLNTFSFLFLFIF